MPSISDGMQSPSSSPQAASVGSVASLPPCEPPSSPPRRPQPRDLSLDIHTQTPTRLHFQYHRFRRNRALERHMATIHPPDFASPHPLPESSRTWAPRSHFTAPFPLHHPALHTHGPSSSSAASVFELQEYLQHLRSMSLSHTEERSRIVAGFHSLSQELSLVLQQRELLSRTAGQPLSAVEEKQREERIIGNADTSHLTKQAREVDSELHRLPLHDLQSRLETDLKLGLTQAEVARKVLAVGPNLLTPPPSPSMLLLFLRELSSGFGPILWVAALLCFLAWRPFGAPPDPTNLGLALIIIIVILLSSSFAFYQARKSSNIITAFSGMLPSLAVARREGRELQVLAAELVPGDVVSVKLGDKVPADIRILSCDSLQVNNSALTGESEPVTCTVDSQHENLLESSNVCFYSSLVVSGSGTGVVINTGDRTVLGHVSALTKLDSGQRTNLQREITRFVWIICSLAVSTAIICLIAWLAWLRPDYPGFLPTSSFLTNVIGLVVAYLPTGLPLSLSLVLTFVAQRMHTQRILVRNLSIVEDFNSVSCILSDKTGTITLNQLTVTNLLWGSGAALPIALAAQPSEPFLPPEASAHPTVQQMLLAAVLCNSATLQAGEASAGAVSEEQTAAGDAVDVALYALGRKCGLQVEEERGRARRVRVLPFNSKSKVMVTVCSQDGSDGEQLLAIVKGAPEFVLQRCDSWSGDDGRTVELTDAHRSIVSSRQELMGSKGYRTIAIAQRSLSRSELELESPDPLVLPSAHYCFLGLIAFMDPPRPGVAAAVVKSQGAGIRVAMVTGDHPSTAVAIARQVNILQEQDSLHSCAVRTDAAGRWVVEIHRGGALQETHVVGAEDDIGAMELSSPVSAQPPSLRQLFSPAEPASADVDPPLVPSPSPSSAVSTSTSSSSASLLTRPDLSNYGVLVTGSDLRCFDRRLWDFVLAHGRMVFARTSPEQKLKIVSECQRRGEIVAVTGDGVNDAPALRRADVGVAMAAGAEVAQEASDMILLNNDFVSVVTAIETGRLVSDNLKKVTLYLLPAGSWSELLPVLANFFLGLPLPLSAFLMIVICMLTDLCPSLALVKEVPERDIMKRRPVVRSVSHLVNWRLLFHAYACIGMIESFSAFFCWFSFFHSQGLPPGALFFAFDSYSDGYYGKSQDELDELLYRGQSIFFVALVVTQLANLLSSRTRYVSFFSHSPLYGPSRNLWLFVAMAVSIAIAVLITQVPFFNSTFHTRSVPVRDVAPAIGFGAAIFVLDEVRKRYIQQYPASWAAWLAW